MDDSIALKKPNLSLPKKEDKLTVAESRVNEHKFLNEHMNVPVNVFLNSGVRLQCCIVGFDDVCLITTHKDSSRKRQLVYKQAISSICEE